MLLDHISYARINAMVDDACRQALHLSKSNPDKTMLVKLFDQLNAGQISLNDLIGQVGESTGIIFRLKFISSILVDMLFCLKKTKESYDKQCSLQLVKTKPKKNISIGINGMPTEYIDHHFTIKLHELLSRLEITNSIDELTPFIAEMLAINEGTTTRYTNIDTQLFYADIIYNNFESIYAEIFKTNRILDINNNQLPCINLYTWVGGDQDGIPFTTSHHSESALNAFSARIKQHYRKDIQAILNKYDDLPLREIPDLLEAFDNPDKIISILNNYEDLPEIILFKLKLKSFGFHYIELEFRENSRVIHEAIDHIIGQDIINKILSIDKPYRELDECDRDRIFTEIMRQQDLPTAIVANFFNSHANYFADKSIEHAGKSVYEIHEADYGYLQKYNARRFLEWFAVIQRYPRASNKFGIAEAKSRTDALAVLFCAKGVPGSHNIHVVLQPEGPVGAEALYAAITKLYQNEIYIAHLRNNGNQQYMTFGPSDICKQGGKGMHITNMQLAKMHRIAAEKHGIELITSIVIGHEHARCNNVLIENLNEFAVNQGSEIRYMLAGLNEMRHLLLTPLMTKNFFKTIYDFQFLSSNDDSGMDIYQERFDFWIKSVRNYENVFFNHAHLPVFLKEAARLDIIKYITMDDRPQSRKYWLEYAEIDPTQIRAIAWTRSLLLAGLHFEWLGANSLAEHSIEFLTQQFKQDPAFSNYIKSVAYACARTNINITWKTLECDPPASFTELAALAQSEVVNSQQFLANIHMCYLESLRLVMKTLFEKELSQTELFNLDRAVLLKYWPDLAEEVKARDQRLNEYYQIIVDRTQEGTWLQNKTIFNNIYSTFINESNTAAAYYLTAHESAFPFLTQGVGK